MAAIGGIRHGWRFEETTGNFFAAVGGVTLTPSGVTQGAVGKIGKCGSYDGINDIAANDALAGRMTVGLTQSFTYYVWAEATQVGVLAATIFSARDAGINGWGLFTFSGGGFIQWQVRDDSGATFTMTSASDLPQDGNFHLLKATFTRAASGLTLAMDNTDISGPAVDTTACIAITPTKFAVGALHAAGDSSFTQGRIDELAQLDHLATAGEDALVWNAGPGRNIFGGSAITTLGV